MNRTHLRIGPRPRIGRATAVLALLGLTACGASSSSSPRYGTPATDSTAATASSIATTDTTAPATAATTGVGLQLSDNPLGKILSDGTGRSLYLFSKDTPTTSSCDGGCAAKWPPLIADSTPALGTGLAAEDVTTITRSDGTKQVAFYGHPLYYFAPDTKPGDTSGQGVGSVWFVVDGEGNPVTG